MLQNICKTVKHRKVILLIPIFICFFGNAFAQPASASMVLISGGNIQFIFQNLANYKNGITLTNQTIWGCTVVDLVPAPAVTGFHVEVAADGGAIEFTGNGGRTLPLNVVQLRGSNVVGLGAAVYAAMSDLPNDAAPLTLMTYTPGVWADTDYTTHQFAVTYEAGIGNGDLLSMDEEPDYYTVTVYFDLMVDF